MTCQGRAAAAAAPTPISRRRESTYQAAPDHTGRLREQCLVQPVFSGMATVVLPSRPTDVEAGGSGAAEAWAGPPRRGGPVRRQRISAGGDFMLLYHKNKYDFKYLLYPVSMISGTYYIIVFVYIPT